MRTNKKMTQSTPAKEAPSVAALCAPNGLLPCSWQRLIREESNLCAGAPDLTKREWLRFTGNSPSAEMVQKVLLERKHEQVGRIVRHIWSNDRLKEEELVPICRDDYLLGHLATLADLLRRNGYDDAAAARMADINTAEYSTARQLGTEICARFRMAGDIWANLARESIIIPLDSGDFWTLLYVADWCQRMHGLLQWLDQNAPETKSPRGPLRKITELRSSFPTVLTGAGITKNVFAVMWGKPSESWSVNRLAAVLASAKQRGRASGSTRQSVTAALQALEQNGLVERVGEEWQLGPAACEKGPQVGTP